jgi:hypothetical protein
MQGVIAAETELCAKIRCFLDAHPAARKQLLKSDRMPTLCQYDPHNRFLDLHPDDRTLVVTCIPFAIGTHPSLCCSPVLCACFAALLEQCTVLAFL